ncbi:hypothetical protein [Brevundimonas sp. FT23028]|uniref:hypothetical protein n=1 Tax=Brevundimonas sp. FT23028 TaxID=3393748 RepID=UPI003B58AFB4
MATLLICPGINRLYRLALVGPGTLWEALGEFDTPEQAIAAKRAAEKAVSDLERVLA